MNDTVCQTVFETHEFHVWTYWSNVYDDRMPPYLRLCLDTIKTQCHGADVVLVTPENMHDFLDDSDIKVDLSCIEMRDPANPAVSLRTDYIRVALLRKYGGLWVDIDCVMLRNPVELLKRDLRVHDFVAMRKESSKTKHISVSFMASRPNGKIISEYKRQIEVLIDHKFSMDEKFGWSEIGSDLLTPIVNAHNEAVMLWPEENIHPFDYTEKDIMERNVLNFDLSGRISSSTICCMLYHSLFALETQYLPTWALLESDIVLSRILRLGLGFGTTESVSSPRQGEDR